MSTDPYFSKGSQNTTVSLGCGTLLLIALIVAIFSRAGSQGQMESELVSLRREVRQLREQQDDQVQRLEKMQALLEQLQRDLSQGSLPAEQPDRP